MPPATACCARSPTPGRRSCAGAIRSGGSAARNSWWSARTPRCSRRWRWPNACAWRPPRCASTTSTRSCGSPPVSVPPGCSAPATATTPCWRAPTPPCTAPSSAAATGWSASPGVRSDRVGVQLAGADPHHLAQVPDEDLAVADLAGAGRLHDRLGHHLDLVVRHRDLQLDLGQEVDQVLGAAVELGMPLLAAEALDLGGGDAGHADLRQRLAHVVELERLDDGHDHLHRTASLSMRRA